MAIPTFFERRTLAQALPPATQPCVVCRTSTVHDVVRHYMTISIFGLPAYGSALAIDYKCTKCGAPTQGRAPAGAPAIPFLHRLGCLVFVGVPAALLVVALGVRHVRAEERRQREAAKQRAMDEAVALAKQATEAVDVAKKKCRADIDASIIGARAGKEVLDLPALTPASGAKLEGAAYVPASKIAELGIPRPTHKHFSGVACDVEVSELVRRAAKGPAGADDFPSEQARSEAEALIAKAKATAAPPVIVVTDYACPSRTKPCVGVAAWIATPEKRLIALVKVEGSMWSTGNTVSDTNELALRLSKAVDSW